ncbi:MAG: TIM barrel protein [Haloarculaceae archaeon]
MVRTSVCLEMVLNDEPFHERVARAANLGADGVEFWGWREKDLDAIRAATAAHDVPIVGCTAGGTLTDPDWVDEAAGTVRESIRVAAELNCRNLIVTTGSEQDGFDRSTQHDAVVDVLSAVTPDAEAAEVTLVLEPLNTAVDHPGYYLTSSSEGFEIVDEVGSERVRLLYDVYHQQITEGNIIQTVTENVDRIGHIHVADVPGRHEPGTGELNYPHIVSAIEDAGYDGYVGCEFSPLGSPEDAMARVLDAH